MYHLAPAITTVFWVDVSAEGADSGLYCFLPKTVRVGDLQSFRN
jgi:hypothetical protein